VGFSEPNARAHVAMLAGTIGSRPVGSPENAKARDYIVDQLRASGFAVRVQETDARRPEAARTARVSNIIAVKSGSRSEAVGLVSHYDSVAEAPGAGDDAFGVAVSLEAARHLASRPGQNWSLMVLVTDGEEAGLMGAAALMDDREVRQRLKTYVNLESAGSSGPAVLFETGPGNGWLITPWRRHAPYPRGDSFGLEIYKRLPNDTDFSILKRHDIPGLNFAITGDSYAYHTARDGVERLSQDSLRQTGENVVATVAALDNADITQRSPQPHTYFDVGGRAAVSYGPLLDWIIAAGALVCGVIAWVRVTSAAIAMGGVWRWLLTFFWTAIGAALVAGSMAGITWALRASREVYHPWYAMPDRLFLLMALTGLAVGWAVVRVGQFLPARVHGLRHPVVTWSATLPIWMLLALGAVWVTPGAAYLWTVPLLVAGVLLTIAPAKSGAAVRLASSIVFAATAVLWVPDSRDVLRFMVAVFGRLPMITPVYVYAAITIVAATMVVPPLVGTIATRRPLLRPSLMTAILLLALSAAAGWAYVAPAYTYAQPLRRYVRATQTDAANSAVWEVASAEPGLDLAEHAPPGWTTGAGPLPAGVPWAQLPHPFVFRNMSGPALGPPPLEIRAYGVQPLPGGVELQLTVVPGTPGVDATFLLPPGLTPARANLPGIVRRGRWVTTYIAVPPEGVTLRASFEKAEADVLRTTEVIATTERFPQGSGWQRLPDWLPQDRTVWAATASWVLRLSDWAGIAPVPPLR
jgi:hypothetical protein